MWLISTSEFKRRVGSLFIKVQQIFWCFHQLRSAFSLIIRFLRRWLLISFSICWAGLRKALNYPGQSWPHHLSSYFRSSSSWASVCRFQSIGCLLLSYSCINSALCLISLAGSLTAWDFLEHFQIIGLSLYSRPPTYLFYSSVFRSLECFLRSFSYTRWFLSSFSGSGWLIALNFTEHFSSHLPWMCFRLLALISYLGGCLSTYSWHQFLGVFY